MKTAGAGSRLLHLSFVCTRLSDRDRRGRPDVREYLGGGQVGNSRPPQGYFPLFKTQWRVILKIVFSCEIMIRKNPLKSSCASTLFQHLADMRLRPPLSPLILPGRFKRRYCGFCEKTRRRPALHSISAALENQSHFEDWIFCRKLKTERPENCLGGGNQAIGKSGF